MPRKYRKTCRNDGFGLYPANRRYQANCRQQVAQPATGKAEGKQRFMRCRRKADRSGGGAVTEPPGYLVKPSGQNQMPGGTGRRRRCWTTTTDSLEAVSPKSTGIMAGERGAGGNTGPIYVQSPLADEQTGQLDMGGPAELADRAKFLQFEPGLNQQRRIARPA